MNKFIAGFIGAGNMGGIIATAVSKQVGPEKVCVCCSSPESTKSAAQRIGCLDATIEQACLSKYLFLGIKPQMAQSVLPNVAKIIENDNDCIVVSMLAGTTIETLCELCGTDRVIRIMPNTPAQVGEGVTLVCSSDSVTADELSEFCRIISLMGKSDVIDEKYFDAATALSGCGPAFVYMFLEAMADGAVKCGLPRDKACEYAARTLIGASRLALLSDKHTSELKDAVCSPGGSTIEGVLCLEKEGMRSAIMDAVCASYEKSKKLGKK